LDSATKALGNASDGRRNGSPGQSPSAASSSNRSHDGSEEAGNASSGLTTPTHRADEGLASEGAGGDQPKNNVRLPATKAARKVAGKATKKASKMASAIARKFRRNNDSCQYEAPNVALPDEPDTPSVARTSQDYQGEKRTLANFRDCAVAHLKDSDLHDLEAARCTATSSYSTPSTERGRSPDNPDRSFRSDHSSGCLASEPDLYGNPLSDSDARKPSRTQSPERPYRGSSYFGKFDDWDAKLFGKRRPLECSSIWDIPTSRQPEPEVLPAGISGCTLGSFSHGSDTHALKTEPMPIVTSLQGGSPFAPPKSWLLSPRGLCASTMGCIVILVVLIALSRTIH